MSKINAVRLINVNYNNNAIRISDECFHFNGESTLLSLRNGGGKSVLVQMLTAPFVHKKYRNTKERPFESYFTTNKPSFILVEWILDGGAGYVLTGMMVRRSQDMGETNEESLEMVNIISEYKEPCLQDIHHLPVVEKGKKEMVLKNFTACRQLFDSYKKDHSLKFFSYDMINAAQSRQYFDKLSEYQINYKEWEGIIKKVNLKESGLSDLFSDCRDEKGLVEKWFLDAVENKLNKDQNRMKEFQAILEKYVGQYRDNRSKIKRRDTIRSFKVEAEKIREKGEVCQNAEKEKKEQENRIARFIFELNELEKETRQESQALSEEMDGVTEKIARIEYERISEEIHKLEEKQLFHVSNRDMIAIEQENLEQEAGQIERKLHLLSCAKKQEDLGEKQGELKKLRQKLSISREKEENLEPERQKLGCMLKGYYEQAAGENKEKLGKNENTRMELKEAVSKEKEQISELDERIRKAIQKEGALKSRTEIFDEQETEYNQRYKEELVRNILGEYEPGLLEIRQKAYEQEMSEETRERVRRKKQLEAGKEKQKQLERLLQDMRTEAVLKGTEKEQKAKLLEEYEEELASRRVILKYLNLEEKALFQKESILNELEKKLLEISGVQRNLEREENELQKEYRRLTEGKILELSEELETELQNLGIHIVYGMEWLKKNGYSEKENQRLVRKHPFLPYALLLSEQELLKLAGHAGCVYTSFPVPIIVRERLEEPENERKGLLSFPDVSFYVLFNENLLDEEKLKLLIEEKEQKLKKKKEAIEIRRKEYQEYFERQEVIKNQKVTLENYENAKEKLEELAFAIEETDRKIRETAEEQVKQRELLLELEAGIFESERKSENQKRRQEDFARLSAAYDTYRETLRELEYCRKEEKRLLERQKLSKEQLEKYQENQRTLETERDDLQREQERLKEALGRYQGYDILAVEGLSPEKCSDMEARYMAITSGLSQELKELEEQEQRAEKYYQSAREELEYLQNKYGLEAGAWLEIRYNHKEEAHQEILLEDRQRKIEGKKRLWNDEDKQTAVISQQIKEHIQRMERECGEVEPLPKEEIQRQDFEAGKNQLEYQKKELGKQILVLQGRLAGYDENLTALSEYSEFSLEESAVWEETISEMDNKELRRFKGLLVRDYNEKKENCHKSREALAGVLNQIIRKEEFKEEFYQKPLEAMLELADSGSQVLRQLDTTVQSYENLMEKLEVDISLVEKEKTKIVELLEDYIQEVHKNLGKIDQNSTITIRERPVKMLKIELPAWEENENLYHIRLEDFIDELTQKGIEIFEKNENAPEYFGTRMTTKGLYDTVIGIGNVQIRLYKIEEQREYPITWAEVAKNSGGEGFLSAFVILSSLLYYMRKDETDLFAERNEGKVLLMDNPFAQTNASHLLKPLMDMAKKTNTQLICLTGLGGESIYNRFDNIYVLNLLAASLRNGMQYLKANHLKGSEPEILVVSRIEVMEQQELLF